MNNQLKHIAIIMDGNGRWAKEKGLARSIGHLQGMKNIERISLHANSIGIKMLTVYAFSTENWKRPKEEIDYLMKLPIEFLNVRNTNKLRKSKIKILFKGRKDRIPEKTKETLDKIEMLTKDNDGLILNICLDYGAYEELLQAINKVKNQTNISIEDIFSNLYVNEPVDLLIRTGGEQRISNFLLMQICYSELYFIKKYWPAFRKDDLNQAVLDYNNRQRRYGGLNE
ncbi:di-trans,poly-cis-decaprenylcistransferase [Acholeplasma sp. OttesenSCG-928-E16]|nr:di-trans,poly-cis-decaprenylcistransferase [Acholeplasma sp. OttesenSCG-928-E16]